jgi:hypothetical protein
MGLTFVVNPLQEKKIKEQKRMSNRKIRIEYFLKYGKKVCGSVMAANSLRNRIVWLLLASGMSRRKRFYGE